MAFAAFHSYDAVEKSGVFRRLRILSVSRCVTDPQKHARVECRYGSVDAHGFSIPGIYLVAAKTNIELVI